MNMVNVIKTYNITYRNPSGSWTVSSKTLNVTLQNLTSGTNYTITLVTVGVRQYQSSPVSDSVYTKPLPVKKLRARNLTSDSVSLIWDHPDEYKSDYTYRVQTANSSSEVNNETTTTNQLNVTNLTPGEKYIFAVFTRAADTVTESISESYTNCTVPGLAQNITVSKNYSTSFLFVTWNKPAGKVDNYTVTLTGDVNNTITTNSTQVNFTNLLPGRQYSIVIQTVSGNCNQTASPVTEATYPTPPQSLIFINITTNSISLSWTEPVNMANVTKTFNITYRNSSGSWTVSSNTLNVTLQNLTSGTNYTITVVTVGVRQYQSSSVTRSIYTKPLPVKQLRSSNVTSDSVSLIWDHPDAYKSDYTYRVQTANSSSVTLKNQTTATNQSVVTDLTAGETYTFTVFTRAADTVTESVSVSYTTCTGPGLAQNISVNNSGSTSSLVVTWIKAAGKVDNYTVTLTGDVNNTITTNSTQVNFTNLLPGRQYSIVIQTVSGNCTQTTSPVAEAIYPTPPQSLTFTNIATNNISLSWTDPVNMTDVTKTFNITYRNSSGSWTVSSNTLNVTLQNLTSGTNYTITAVTVGARQYQSSPVTRSIYTKPLPVKQLRSSNVTSDSVSLIWDHPDEYKSDYSYRVQTANSSSVTLKTQITATNQSVVTNLTAGETYTFTVFTRAADTVTESEPISYTTCTVPGLAQNISVNNNGSTSFLVVTWIKAAGKVDNYTVTLTGDVNNTITTNSTQVNFTNLLPGRQYSIEIQTVSGNCNQTASPVTEATYPTPPQSLIFTNITTNSISLSWTEPVNMANVTKTFNITYRNSSGSWTVSSNTLNVTLQNLTSGTNYTITVVTVGVRQYQSSSVSRSVYTKPLPVKQLRSSNVTSDSVSLIWDHPDEYKSDYTYRVQTANSSSVTLKNQTTATNQSVVTNLTPGETYTFTVFTRAADTVTESEPVSYTICIAPSRVQSVTVSNVDTATSLFVTWIKPAGKVDNYTVTLTGDVNNTITTNSTQVNFTNLLPGRQYSIVIQTVSGNCKQASSPVTEATYPTPPQSLIFTNIGTNSISLSWTEPVNMTNVTKTFNITYRNSSGSWTVSSNTLNVTLQNLTSGTNYTITVVTVGVRQYQSSPVTRSVYTKPLPVKRLRADSVTFDSVSLIWDHPDEYKSDYTYRVQTANSSSVTLKNQTTATNQYVVTNLTALGKYTFTVFTRAADDFTESDASSSEVCTDVQPSFQCNTLLGQATLSFSWTCPTGFYAGSYFTVSNGTSKLIDVTVNCTSSTESFILNNSSYDTVYFINITKPSCDGSKTEEIRQCRTSVAPPAPVPENWTISKPPETPSSDQFVFTFPEFDNTNGALEAYAVIITSGGFAAGEVPTGEILSKTYHDYKNQKTKAYVTRIMEMNKNGRSARSLKAGAVSVNVGDGSNSHGYYNGPLEPSTSYRVSVAGFSAIEFDDATGTILENRSLVAYSPFSDGITTSETTTPNTTQNSPPGSQNSGVIAGAVVGSLVGCAALGAAGVFLWKKKRQSPSPSNKSSLADKIQQLRKGKGNGSFILKERTPSKEFRRLKSVGIKKSQAADDNGEYCVRLPTEETFDGDYKNPVFIPGPNSEKEFIVAQNPTRFTRADFWKMIIGNNIRTIVMISESSESDKVEKESYWSTTTKFDEINITSVSETALLAWTIRDIRVTNERKTHQVQQFQFTAWTETLDARARETFIRFVQLFRKQHTTVTPTLVHGSGGRTGVFIALDHILSQLEKGKQVDVYEIVYALHKNQPLMVPTEEQYFFLHQCAEDLREVDKQHIYSDMQDETVYEAI
uniref:protein-tyrosine-phosphatase n=1 Tax=Leptobrachium leishanense TaxID=445787 RepID=A0A8C5R5R9_9ANUR